MCGKINYLLLLLVLVAVVKGAHMPPSLIYQSFPPWALQFSQSPNLPPYAESFLNQVFSLGLNVPQLFKDQVFGIIKQVVDAGNPEHSELAKKFSHELFALYRKLQDLHKNGWTEERHAGIKKHVNDILGLVKQCKDCINAAERASVVGVNNVAVGLKNCMIGKDNSAKGSNISVVGDANTIEGDRSSNCGNCNCVNGKDCFTFGNDIKVKGDNNIVFGSNKTLEGDNKLALDKFTIDLNALNQNKKDFSKKSN